MSDQLPMFDPMNSRDTPSAISSPESVSGLTPSVLQDGPTTAKSGPDHAHANPSARPAKEKRSTTKGIFGQSGFHSSKHEDLSFALASKLRPLTDSLGSTLFNLTWMTRVTPAGRSISALRASEPLTEGSVFIGWPTAQARDWKGPQGRSYKGTAIDLPAAAWPTPQKHDERERGNTMADHHHFPHDLSNAATLAGSPTTRATDAEKNVRTTEGSAREMERKGGPQDLMQAASLTAWGTPAARDWKSGEASQETLDRNARPLSELAKLGAWPTPMAGTPAQKGYNEAGNTDSGRKTVEMCRLPVGPSMDSGATPIGYLLGRNGWEIVPASGQLNAAHSRWLMGLPPAWDDCGVTAMESLRKRRKRS